MKVLIIEDYPGNIDLVRTRLRSDPNTASIPLIPHSVFVSHAADLPEAMVQVDGFLPKPFRLVDLAQLIGRIRDTQRP